MEAGRSLLVRVERADGGAWPLRVPRDARLQHLKAALRTQVTRDMVRGGRGRGRKREGAVISELTLCHMNYLPEMCKFSVIPTKIRY